MRKRLSLMTYTMVVYSVSSIVLFFYVIVTGASFGPYERQDWVLFLLLAVIPNLLGHTLLNWSIKYLSANVISVSILFEPIGAAILAFFIFNEHLGPSQLLGGGIVILGITLFVTDLVFLKNFFYKKC